MILILKVSSSDNKIIRNWVGSFNVSFLLLQLPFVFWCFGKAVIREMAFPEYLRVGCNIFSLTSLLCRF